MTPPRALTFLRPTQRRGGGGVVVPVVHTSLKGEPITLVPLTMQEATALLAGLATAIAEAAKS